MSPADADPARDAFVRPFLQRRRAGGTGASTPATEEPPSAVRPYFVARGARPGAHAVAFETMLTLTSVGRQAISALRYEQRDLARVCATAPLSVAEAAAQLRVPIGVVRVLAADLARDGMLELHGDGTGDRDVGLIVRVRDALRAL